MSKRTHRQSPPPSSPGPVHSRSFFTDAVAIAKYACLETTPPVNLFLFLNAIFHGTSVACSAETGVATLTGRDLAVQVPLSLTTGRSGQLGKDDAVELALACCRIHGVQGFCYAWTRRGEPIFRELVATLRSAMGHLPWQLEAAWRIGRADLYDAVAVLQLQLVSEMPEAYRLDTLADRLFSAAWTLDAATGADLGGYAQEWGIMAARCGEADARLEVAGQPLFIAQRDWAFLALNLLFTPELSGIRDRIPEVSRAHQMLSR